MPSNSASKRLSELQNACLAHGAMSSGCKNTFSTWPRKLWSWHACLQNGHHQTKARPIVFDLSWTAAWWCGIELDMQRARLIPRIR
eukprot:2988335-Alexandrium_andersonii.AAC.1